jgi:hypothetical protein
MFAILHALGMFVADMFKARWRLEGVNLFLTWNQIRTASRGSSHSVVTPRSRR